MIDEKIVYGGLTGEERKAKIVQYHCYHIYRDLVTLANRIYAAKKELKPEQLGIVGELDVASLIEQMKELGEIDWSKMPNMDHHYKVKWQQDAA
jgi:ribosome biogenesis SPOUT family RNA methylase Rps3